MDIEQHKRALAEMLKEMKQSYFRSVARAVEHGFAGKQPANGDAVNAPDQAVSLMRIIDAAYGSARTGKPVKC